MTDAADLIAVARAQVGYVEHGGPTGHDGNITKYWAELQPSYQGQPWCAAFVSWVFKHAGHPLPAIDHPWGFSYTPDAVIWARKHGLWSTGRGHPGDIVLFDFDGTGVADHTEILVHDDGTTIHDIGGNTSGSSAGDQRNGGEVAEKSRPRDSTVLGFLQASTWLTKAGAPGKDHPPPTPTRMNPFPPPQRLVTYPPPPRPGRTRHGMQVGGDVRFVQWAAGAPVDGECGPATEKAIRQFQSYHPGCGPADGVAGPRTVRVLGTVRR